MPPPVSPSTQAKSWKSMAGWKILTVGLSDNVIPALARVCAAVAGSNSFSTVTPDQTSTGATSSTIQKSVASSATQKGPTTSTTLQPEPTGGEREQADETVRGQTGLSSETIAGSVVGGVAALAIGVGLVVFLLRRKGRGTVAEEVKQGDETVAELDGKSNVIYELDAKTRPQPAELASERQVLELD